MGAMIPDAGQEPDVETASKRLTVLLLSSDSPDSRALGGVALHVAALARNASAHVHLYTAHPRGGALHVERWSPQVDGRSPRAGRLVAAVPLAPPGALASAGAERALSAVIAGTGADVLHVHSPLLEPGAIARAARNSGVRLAMTLHDHAFSCENYTLLEGGERHCGIPEDLTRCDACLARTLGRAPGEVLRHRARMGELASATHAFVAPSRSVLELCTRVHPEIEARAHRIPWGAPSRPSPVTTPSPAGAPSTPLGSRGPLRIAFVGLLSKPKGRERLAPLLSACRDLDVEWHVFGATEGMTLRDVERSAPRVVFHGAYRREDLPRRLALAGCHVGFLPSIFAESFSLALSDVLSAGLPVLASDLGALAERVTEESLGWTFDPWVPGTLASVVSRLCADRTLVDDARARVRSRAVRTDADMARDHVRLWHALSAAPRSRPAGTSVLALTLYREGERRAQGASRALLFPLVARLRGTLFYQDLRLRGLVSESRRKAVERVVTSLFARARRR
jgi:glycosyltransferase involved in cell wall biosynthesis